MDWFKSHIGWKLAYLVLIFIFLFQVQDAVQFQLTSRNKEIGMYFYIGWIFVFGTVIFIQLFTELIPSDGPDPDQIRHWMIFSYIFMIFSLVALTYPFIAERDKAFYGYKVEQPIAILQGCSVDKAVAKEIQCLDVCEDTKISIQKMQWLVNIGGSVKLCPHDKNTYYMTGGIQVPLYFVIFALIGGAISLTRRVPEYQRRSSHAYVPSKDKPKLTPDQVREYLVFQIVQFISAPLLALVAYYLITPESGVATVVLGFAVGFSSESVLLMIRATLEKITPKPIKEMGTGCICGNVIDSITHRGAVNMQIKVIGNSEESTKTDEYGHFVIDALKPGNYALEVKSDSKSAIEKVTIESGKTKVCNILL
jgi:hypothetical protein